jgi:hypothetical protein
MDNESLGADQQKDEAAIIAFTEDLFLEPRLQDAARHLGYSFEIIDSPERFGGGAAREERVIPLTEPLRGPDAAFIRWLAASRPGLLLFDAGSKVIPWAHWIQLIKTSAATRRIPVIAFGPHVEEESLDLARKAGADAVVTRGQLQRSLGSLIQEWFDDAGQASLAEACAGKLSSLALVGIKAHNAGHFFEAHEDLEHAWMEAEEDEGYLYRALLQLTVAHLHLERGNLAGAVKMLMRIHRWLDPLPDHCRGIDLQRLREQIEALRLLVFEQMDSGLKASQPEELLPIKIEVST